MEVTNEWCIFKEVLDSKTCSKLKNAYKKDGWEPSSVDVSKGITNEERRYGRHGDYKEDPDVRTSDVSWVNEQWVYDLIWPFMLEANDVSGWKYRIKASEPCQLTRYKKGGFYNFHRDGNGDHLSVYNNPNNPFLHGRVRKLSMSVVLNNSFEGGAFEVSSYDKEKCDVTSINLKAGSVIVFPSFIEHRVAPVTKGTRYSLVTWFVGPPFE